jgi:hypothetical protein
MGARSHPHPPTPGTFSRLLNAAVDSFQAALGALLDAYRLFFDGCCCEQLRADLRGKILLVGLVC